MTRHPIPAAAALILASAWAAGQEQATWAVLEPAATVRGLEVRLGDVARVGGTDAATARRLGSLRVAATPPAGGMLVLSRGDVAAALRRAGWTGTVLRGAGHVRVRAAQVRLGPDEVAALALRALHDHLGADAAEARVTALRAPRALTAVAGRYSTRFEVVLPEDDGPLCGAVQLVVRPVVDHRALPGVPVGLTVHREGLVLAAAEDLPAGRPVDPRRVRLVPVDLGLFGDRAFGAVAELDGRLPRARIRRGEVLRRSDFGRPPVVLRSAPVTVVYRSGALTIRLAGRALRDGAAGERIPVRTGTGGRQRTRYGVVRDARTVEVGPHVESKP